MDEKREKRIAATLIRIGILLVILVAIGPIAMWLGSRTSGPKSWKIGDPSHARMPGDPTLLVRDVDEDGIADCLFRTPTMKWFRRGYTAAPELDGCGGWRMKPMEPEMREALSEWLRLTVRLETQYASIVDLDGDAVADCVTAGATRYFVEGAGCPDPAEDARPMTEEERSIATRALRLEITIRESMEL